jgi:uncharacterized membrane protein SirB2
MISIVPTLGTTAMDVAYQAVKYLHVGAAAVSVALFIVRIGWMMESPGRLQQRWVKVVPHVIDTILLLSALWLAWQIGADGTRGWLAAKIGALVLYIALGMIALKRGKTRRVRIAAAAAALATFVYIVTVALTKSPRGVFSIAIFG